MVHGLYKKYFSAVGLRDVGNYRVTWNITGDDILSRQLGGGGEGVLGMATL